jgi:hypothetical protein
VVAAESLLDIIGPRASLQDLCQRLQVGDAPAVERLLESLVSANRLARDGSLFVPVPVSARTGKPLRSFSPSASDLTVDSDQSREDRQNIEDRKSEEPQKRSNKRKEGASPQKVKDTEKKQKSQKEEEEEEETDGLESEDTSEERAYPSNKVKRVVKTQSEALFDAHRQDLIDQNIIKKNDGMPASKLGQWSLLTQLKLTDSVRKIRAKQFTMLKISPW